MSKRRGRLVGSAKDPVTARLTLEEFFPRITAAAPAARR